ncbi:hypothetical protein DFH09DRAFT_1157346 [Mycena vulgaris]|nr:hypothetical protein DFH09DRAFT_1157346 [Mycena vulgaris]
MVLRELDSDVLLQIFALMDVYTVLSLSRVNKAFHELASTKHLWRSVVRDLSSRYLVDAPAAEVLETFSTAQLVDEVKRVVAGPRTWSPACSRVPRLLRQHTISPGNLVGRRVDTEFLPDGRHILIYKSSNHLSRGVECWDVHLGRQVWAWSFPLRYIQYVTFDLRRGGLEALVVLCVLGSGRRMLVLEADLTTGASRELLNFCINARLRQRMENSGDFIACAVYFDWGHLPPAVLLVNWNTTEFVLVDCSNLGNLQVALCPGHVVLSCSSTSDSESAILDQIRIYSITSLAQQWRPVIDNCLHHPTDSAAITSVTVNVPGNNLHETPDYHYIGRSFSESLVHDRTYVMMVRVVDCRSVPSGSGLTHLVRRIRDRLAASKSWFTTLSRYRLSLPASTPSPPPAPQLKYTLRPRKSCTNMSAAGYGLSWTSFTPQVGPFRLKSIYFYRVTAAGISRPRALTMPEAAVPSGSGVQMARTGAVMLQYDSRIIVCHYL